MNLYLCRSLSSERQVQSDQMLMLICSPNRLLLMPARAANVITLSCWSFLTMEMLICADLFKSVLIYAGRQYVVLTRPMLGNVTTATKMMKPPKMEFSRQSPIIHHTSLTLRNCINTILESKIANKSYDYSFIICHNIHTNVANIVLVGLLQRFSSCSLAKVQILTFGWNIAGVRGTFATFVVNAVKRRKTAQHSRRMIQRMY